MRKTAIFSFKSCLNRNFTTVGEIRTSIGFLNFSCKTIYHHHNHSILILHDDLDTPTQARTVKMPRLANGSNLQPRKLHLCKIQDKKTLLRLPYYLGTQNPAVW